MAIFHIVLFEFKPETKPEAIQDVSPVIRPPAVLVPILHIWAEDGFCKDLYELEGPRGVHH